MAQQGQNYPQPPQQYNPAALGSSQQGLNRPVNEVESFIPQNFDHEATDRNNSGDTFYGATLTCFGDILGLFGSIPCCICFSNPYKQIEQGRVGLFSSFGKYRRTNGPGLAYFNLLTEQLYVVDVRQQAIDLSRQTALTRDNVSVAIDAVLFFSIVQPYRAIFEVQDVTKALIDRTQTTLRTVAGIHDVQDLITNRDSVANEIQRNISMFAKQCGCQVENILLKDIIFDQQLQESMAAVAVARRVGASRIIQAQSEAEAANLLSSTAKLSMNIRYLDTLKAMAHEANSKVVFMPPASFDGYENEDPEETGKPNDLEKGSYNQMKKTVVNDVMSNF